MTVRLSTALRNKLAGPTGFGTTFDKGVIYIYSGPPLVRGAFGRRPDLLFIWVRVDRRRVVGRF